jgi:hypothetical protein
MFFHTHLPQSSSSSHSVEIPLKTRYKHKQSETIMKISHINVDIYDKTATSRQNSALNLLFFCIFHIFSPFKILFFQIFHIFSLFNLSFFHIVHIFSQFDLPFFHIFPHIYPRAVAGAAAALKFHPKQLQTKTKRNTL